MCMCIYIFMHDSRPRIVCDVGVDEKIIYMHLKLICSHFYLLNRKKNSLFPHTHLFV